MWIVAFITVVAVLIFASRMKELKDARESDRRGRGISSKYQCMDFSKGPKIALYRLVDPGHYIRHLRLYDSGLYDRCAGCSDLLPVFGGILYGQHPVQVLLQQHRVHQPWQGRAVQKH